MQESVKVNEELADRSAAYLAMWKALEAFDPKVDRWSEPVSFGSQKERAKVAEGAISRFSQRHPIDVREIQCRGAACCARSGKAFAVSENNTIFCGYQ